MARERCGDAISRTRRAGVTGMLMSGPMPWALLGQGRGPGVGMPSWWLLIQLRSAQWVEVEDAHLNGQGGLGGLDD